VGSGSAAALADGADLIAAAARDAGVAVSRLGGVGVGLPTMVDPATGAVASSMLLSDWARIDVARELADRVRRPVRVDNDANLGALAESLYGAARGVGDAVYVKASAEIGAGLILGGRLYRGSGGLAGELGHVHVRRDGNLCRCGSRGCLGTSASSTAMLELLRPRFGPGLDLAGLLTLVRRGDPAAYRVVTDAGADLGRALGDVCNLLNPKAIVIGGELGAIGEPLLGSITAGLQHHAQPEAAAVPVMSGALGLHAEAIGAVALAAATTQQDQARAEPPLTSVSEGA
jgi:predicted NBD/HSP70 family sugar kinase